MVLAKSKEPKQVYMQRENGMVSAAIKFQRPNFKNCSPVHLPMGTFSRFRP